MSGVSGATLAALWVYLASPCHRDNVVFLAAQQRIDVPAPGLERGPRLGLESVPLVRADNPAAAAADVAENRLDRLEPGTKPLQAGRARLA